jgi:hypothetical protein
MRSSIDRNRSAAATSDRSRIYRDLRLRNERQAHFARVIALMREDRRSLTSLRRPAV